jgi:acetylornithine deacetylase/succinyl-diaminopimelate desuccinylase-like protein
VAQIQLIFWQNDCVLHDENNHITIPVLRQCRRTIFEERAEMAKGFHLALKNALKLNDVYGESAVTCNKRNSLRPTLDVNGIGGYIGEGKTVIASQAFAKISMRLVPNQDWEQITELFTKHL